MGKLFVQIKAVRLYWFEFASLNPVLLWTLTKSKQRLLFFCWNYQAKNPGYERVFSRMPRDASVSAVGRQIFGRNHRVHASTCASKTLAVFKESRFYSSISWILASRNLFSYCGFFICHAISRSSWGDQSWIFELLKFVLSPPSSLR